MDELLVLSKIRLSQTTLVPNYSLIEYVLYVLFKIAAAILVGLNDQAKPHPLKRMGMELPPSFHFQLYYTSMACDLIRYSKSDGTVGGYTSNFTTKHLLTQWH